MSDEVGRPIRRRVSFSISAPVTVTVLAKPSDPGDPDGPWEICEVEGARECDITARGVMEHAHAEDLAEFERLCREAPDVESADDGRVDRTPSFSAPIAVPNLPARGWGWPSNSRKAHFFFDGRALCGKWAFFGKLELGNDASGDNCAACRRAVAATKKAEAATVEAVADRVAGRAR